MIWYAQLLLLAPTLFDQSIVHLLQRNFPKTQFLLVKLFSALSGSALDLPNAIAESCNSYFLQLNAAAIPEQVRAMPARFHLPDPRDFTPENLTGIGTQWPISPRRIATAYAALASDESAVGIREGMRMSAKHGTAKALRSEALAKTGTAPCSHAKKAPGYGYVAVLYPASSPRYVLLVQVHGVSGAVAAHTAGEMLKVIRDGK